MHQGSRAYISKSAREVLPSHARLNMLPADIEKKTGENQIVANTHSSYVANKLMLNRLVWIDGVVCEHEIVAFLVGKDALG